MAEIQQNTLYVMTQGAYLHRDHQTVKVEIEKQTRLAVPVHHLESLSIFGNVLVSPGVLHLCAEAGVAVTFLTETGRLLARLDAPQSGNVLLRRAQYRIADQVASGPVAPDGPAVTAAVSSVARNGGGLKLKLELARHIVAGKLQNSRTLLQRAARETDDANDRAVLEKAVVDVAYGIEQLPRAASLDAVRGHEGAAAAAYFDAFNALICQQREHFRMNGRNRRPPLDPVNALLSFAYALLLHDCVAALTAAGLDPSVGFLHADRPGRPGLALDLMEEFRPLLADRLVLALINRKQVAPDDFQIRPGGAVEMSEAARKKVVVAYQQRKQEQIKHPLLDITVPFGRLPFLQAKLLARAVRGESEAYPPLVLK